PAPLVPRRPSARPPAPSCLFPSTTLFRSVEDGSDDLGRPRLGGQREPVDEHGSGGGLVEPEEASHGRGLAGSVRAEETGDGSVGDREAQSFNSGHLAVALRETVDLDHARTPWDRLAESGWPSRPPVRRPSSTGDAAATTAATTRAPSARPESTSWTKWTPAATREAAIASARGTANQARRGTTRMQAVAKAAARTA